MSRGWADQLLYELTVAYHEARRGGKRKTFDEHKFELHDFENLIKLRDSLIDRSYRPSRGTAHIIHNPVQREIFAAPFRDRVVHHWIFEMVYEWWDRRFIADSYSCRRGKGTLYGIQRFHHHLQAASENFKEEIYVIKLDIQGYFMSLVREKLYERVMWGLKQQFEGNHGKRYQLLKFCWEQTIFDDPCRGVKRKGWPEDWSGLPNSKSLFCQRPGTGIVIGNLTSQLLSNVFLDQLDRYIVYDLGYKHYGRYVDDFFIVVKKKDLPKAMKDVERIEEFLNRLGLTLHPKKRIIQPADNGTNFLGATVFPGRIVPGRRLIRNARKAMREVENGRKDSDTVVSYLGHMKYMKSRNVLKEIFDEVGWEYK